MLSTALASTVSELIGENLDLSLQFANLSFAHIATALLSSLICGLVIYFTYRFFYKGLVYSDNFNILLVMISVITAFIIMTISANLVLSLGLVGALSIVRFRSAIKDPLDTGFLFWAVGVGITAGAGLYIQALIGTAFVALVYVALTILKKQKRNYLLIIRYKNGADTENNVAALLGTLKYRLKNKSSSAGITEITVEINIRHNDDSQIARFSAVDGVIAATLLEYDGEYMN